MKMQLRKFKFWIIIFLILVFYCKDKENKKNYFLELEKKEKSDYKIYFLQKNYKEWEANNYHFGIHSISFQEKYIPKGIPNKLEPEFTEEGCFYFLNSFYFYNEFGISIRYCNLEIRENYIDLKNFINNINKNIFNINLNLNSIFVKEVSLNSLKKEKFQIIYNSFKDYDFKEMAQLYLFSKTNFEKNSKSYFLPKRFYETEFAILLNQKEVFFLYKLGSQFYYIKINDKQFYEDLFRFFYNIKDFINSVDQKEKEIQITKVFFKDKINKIRISTNFDYFYTFNPKTQKYIFIFPYSHLILNQEEMEYFYKNNLFTLFFNHSYDFSLIFKNGILRNQWMILEEGEFVPLGICLWNDPCSIKDLNEKDLRYPSEMNHCDLDQFLLTEINPFGLEVNSNISAYGKFIEILSNQKCENTFNKIYLSIENTLIEFPENIEKDYYIFAPSTLYFYYEKIIENQVILKLNFFDQISLVQFFPYKKKVLFNGITEAHKQIFFIYGDPNNKIFPKISSLSIKNDSEWEFHPAYCKGLLNCNFGMSPGFPNLQNNNNKKCLISEIFIGGPKNYDNKRISEDEFIEFECKEENNVNLNFFEIEYENQIKKYYFPSPNSQISLFVIFSEDPKCIKLQDKIIFKELILPNRTSVFRTSVQNIIIDSFFINNYANHQIPKSLNYINESLFLPSLFDLQLEQCIGNATPGQVNKPIPYLFKFDNYLNQYILFSNFDFNDLEIYSFKNELFYKNSLIPNQIFNFSSLNINFYAPYQKKELKFVLNSTYEQYEEFFSEEPLCFIESIHPNTIEWIRVCFLKEENFNLYLEDQNQSSLLIPYQNKFNSYELPDDLLALQKNFYRIFPNECILIVEPKSNLLNIKLNKPEFPFFDKYLVTSLSNKLGNGITEEEAIQIFTFINQNKVPLCSYGSVDFKKVPFSILSGKVGKNKYYKNQSFYGIFNFELISLE